MFGTSTASYQIEGAWDEDGKGPSIWDTFTAEPGRIKDGSTGKVACDHYHRYVEDVALMKRARRRRLPVLDRAGRGSSPTGTGPVNTAGLDFYDRLVDELVGAGIEPMATLYHWDLPQALQDRGGWESRATAERFAEYAALCAERLGDRVGKWVPVNEPNVVTVLGHGIGEHAPGKELGFDALPGRPPPQPRARPGGAGAAGQRRQRGRHRDQPRARSGRPPTGPEDVAAADLFDSLWNRIFADPMLLGRYPDGFAERAAGRRTATSRRSSSRSTSTASTTTTRCGLGARSRERRRCPFEQHDIPGYPTTDFGWPIVPEGLRQVIGQLVERYPDIPPIYITENGCSYGMGPDEHGVVDDQPRIDYLDSHLRAVG